MSDEKRENSVSGSSEPEEVDSGAEDAEVLAASPPKKRGRPPKGGDKVEKVSSGRGRGRPKATESSDTEVVENGKKVAGVRGRPPKAGVKKVIVIPSGKGRGRPKAAPKRVAAEGNEGGDSPKKVQAPGGKRGRSRITVQASDEEESEHEEEEDEQEDDEDDDDDDEDDVDDEAYSDKKKLGRPATGAVFLDIKRTGKGQGRPSNAKVARATQRAADEASGKVLKSRGRPKSKAAAEEEVKKDDDDEVEEETEDKPGKKQSDTAERTKLAAA